MNPRPVVLLAIAVMFATAGCSSDSKVGDESLLKGLPSARSTARLGEPAATRGPTPRASARSAGAPRPSRTSSVTTPPPGPIHTPAGGPAVAITIQITSDTSGTTPFDPSAARIFVGTCAKWINKDRVAHSVVADSGGFRSKDLAPGATFVYCPGKAGRFNYHDGQRPYAVAYLEALPR